MRRGGGCRLTDRGRRQCTGAAGAQARGRRRHLPRGHSRRTITQGAAWLTPGFLGSGAGTFARCGLRSAFVLRIVVGGGGEGSGTAEVRAGGMGGGLGGDTQGSERGAGGAVAGLGGSAILLGALGVPIRSWWRAAAREPTRGPAPANQRLLHR